MLWGVESDGWRELSACFDELLTSRLPELALHLEQLGLLPQMYLPEWLMPLFSRSLAPEATAHVWSMLLCEGDAYLLRAALGLMRAISSTLVSCDELSLCREALAAAPATLCVEELADAIGHESLHASDYQVLAPWLS